MLQERNENRAARALDLLLVAILFLLVLLARAFNRAAGLYAWRGIAQLALFLAFITLGGLFYKKRLLSYRYTFFYKEPGAGAEDSQYPFPAGTLLLEQMLGDRLQMAQAVIAREMLAIFQPDGASAIGIIPSGAKGAKQPRLRKLAMTTGPRRRAHSLLFCQQGKYYRLYFNPSDEMARLLGEAIAAVHKP